MRPYQFVLLEINFVCGMVSSDERYYLAFLFLHSMLINKKEMYMWGMKRRMQTEKKISKISGRTWVMWVAVGTMVATVILVLFLFRIYMTNFQKDDDVKTYSKYYVMIVHDRKSDFSKEIYESAYETGLENGAYVELLGDNLLQNYSELELLEIATYSDVDGIIVEADESEAMSQMIDNAVDAGIPVVTVNTDNTQSKRCSYVGKGNYDIGRVYGRLVLDIANAEQQSQDVLVLVGMNQRETGQNIVLSGIQETLLQENESEDLTFNLTMEPIDDSSTFKVEESIRDLFMRDEVPNIIICLNETNTTCVYQAVVDYNKVGDINILGYHTSDMILKGIERNVIDATVTVDTVQMGQYCVDALMEYETLGNTSDYFAVDIALIDKDNVTDYMGGDEDAER